MTCETCGATMKARAATKNRPHYYAIGGLPQFPLTEGVTVYTCPKCRAESVEIEAPGWLHQHITRALLTKPTPLTGDELRFLRKQAGFAAQRFAEMIGVDPAHLSRIENGKREGLGTTTERLARLIIAMAEERAVPADGVLLPTGTEGAGSHEIAEWKRFVAKVATPSRRRNRKLVPELWSPRKQRGAPAKSR